MFAHKIEEVAASQLLEAIHVICRNPFFEDRYKRVRVYNIHRFPYQVVYKIESDLIVIIAFFPCYT